MNDERIISYEGNEPYIFISYCHDDSERIMPILRHIQEDGYRIWYDEEIEFGIEWAKVIERHLVNASCMIAFLTESYLDSDNCLDEIEHAKNKGIKILMVYLEDIEVPGWFEMRHNRRQGVLKSHYNSEESFYNRIYSAKMLDTSKQLNNDKQFNDDIESIIKWVQEELVEKRNTDAQSNSEESFYNRIYSAKMLDASKQLNNDIESLIRAAENGNAKAQYQMGEYYHREEDYEKAVKWYKMAAYNGNDDAKYMLDMMYLCGHGVEENFEEADKWLNEFD